MDVQAALPTISADAGVLSPRQMLTYTGAALLGEKAPDRCVWFRAATRAKDRHGTIIEPGGIELRYHRQNPVFIWAHAPGRDRSRRMRGWSTREPRSVSRPADSCAMARFLSP